MFAITGITGKVGSEVGRVLLAAKRSVRAVVRDASKGSAWTEAGCEVAVADMEDVKALGSAFAGTEGVFVLLPPIFDPSPGFPEARATIAALRSALTTARPAKVVCISTIGAQAPQTNLLSQLGIMEKELGQLPMPVTFIRPGWFMENCNWDVAPARATGVIHSFLQPLDKVFPMVATADVGRTAAELLQETSTGVQIVELEGPHRVSPNDIAAAFSQILGKPVKAQAVEREKWAGMFKSQGMTNPMPRVRMLEGFCDGWIEFAGGQTESRKGVFELTTVLQALVDAG